MVTEKFGYDANGSLTTRKNGSDALLFRQGYDLKNRLVEADVDGDGDADLRLAYDQQEGRVARHELDGSGAVMASEHYLLDRMNPTGYEQVLEQAGALDDAPARSFLLGLSLILQADGSTLRSFLYDGHGTNRALVDATGQIASGQILAYDAFGVRTDGHSSVLTPIQYTGQWFDALLGQGYHRHRYFMHALGAWNGFDAFEGLKYLPLTLHKYQYGHASPLAHQDPTGRFSYAEILTVLGISMSARERQELKKVVIYKETRDELLDQLLDAIDWRDERPVPRIAVQGEALWALRLAELGYKVVRMQETAIGSHGPDILAVGRINGRIRLVIGEVKARASRLPGVRSLHQLADGTLQMSADWVRRHVEDVIAPAVLSLLSAGGSMLPPQLAKEIAPALLRFEFDLFLLRARRYTRGWRLSGIELFSIDGNVGTSPSPSAEFADIRGEYPAAGYLPDPPTF